MELQLLDWTIIGAFFVISMLIGVAVFRRAGSSTAEFFLSGRNMPWWVLGVSMVATTFAADTPALVTDIVRNHGVSGNWVWWAFLLTGMLTTFVYAKLWRRAGLMTDLGFYELRYSGGAAAFLRAFRALYLGVLFNVMIMATVSLAAIKIGGVLLGLSPVETLLIAGLVTVTYSALGGLTSVLITDVFQFVVAMVGSIFAAYYLVNLPDIGGLEAMLSHEAVAPKLNILPDFSDPAVYVPMLILPLAIQWWSVWYPGSEPGGGGYVVQRMLSARSEGGAVGATLLFNIVHYAVRPWPWIVIALASLIVFPDLGAIRERFPGIGDNILQDDIAYFAMLSYLPTGLLGVVVASLIAAYMSTISTHLNWGSSYVVNDFYFRFVNPEASEKELVRVGRLSTVALMALSAILALFLRNQLQAFNILLSIGAGTGLIFILRWFWWRINAYTEIAGMIVSFVVAIYLQLVHPALGFEPLSSSVSLPLSVGVTTVGWLAVTLLTAPTDDATLRRFYHKVRPAGPGWRPVLRRAAAEGRPLDERQVGSLTLEILCVVVGSFMVYFALFGLGAWIYGNTVMATALTGLVVAAGLGLFTLWRRIRGSIDLPESNASDA